MKNHDVKRLSHLCLKLNGHLQSDIVLLSVNALQKDITDMDPLNRGIAIRTISSIQGHAVPEGVLKAIQRGSVDSSVYVRKCSAGCLLTYTTRLSDAIGDEIDEIKVIVERLLGDYEIPVVSMASMVLWNLFSRFDSLKDVAMCMLHAHFTRLTEVLLHMDWVGQFYTIRLLNEYSLRNFAESSSNSHYVSFLEALRKVVISTRSSSVVFIGIKVLNFHKQNETEDWSVIIGKHLFAMPPSMIEQFLNLNGIKVKRIKPFLINTFSDSDEVKKKKVIILRNSLNAKNADFLLSEFTRYVRSTYSEDLISQCMEGLVKIGNISPSLHGKALNVLINCVGSSLSAVSNAAVHALCSLMHENSVSIQKKVCISLSQLVGHISEPRAKASALWLIQKCHDSVPEIIPNVLQKVAVISLSEQDSVVKLELSALALRVSQSSNTKGTSLDEIIKYIFAVCSRDKLVGNIVQVMSSGNIQSSNTLVGNFINLKSNSVVEKQIIEEPKRPHQDTPDSLRIGNKAMKQVVLVSEESSSHRMSRKSVDVPSATTIAPVRTLEDLDLFFSMNDEVVGK